MRYEAEHNHVSLTTQCCADTLRVCRQRYIMTSREVKRWDATSRSPVYASLSTTLKVRTIMQMYVGSTPLDGHCKSCLHLSCQMFGASTWIALSAQLDKQSVACMQLLQHKVF